MAVGLPSLLTGHEAGVNQQTMTANTVVAFPQVAGRYRDFVVGEISRYAVSAIDMHSTITGT
jgi:hypothetical protein